jgi:hypothetical protein
LGCGFTWKNFQNNAQWGLKPNNASKKRTKIKVWKTPRVEMHMLNLVVLE